MSQIPSLSQRLRRRRLAAKQPPLAQTALLRPLSDPVLGDRLMVGLQTLTLPVKVRILVPQPPHPALSSKRAKCTNRADMKPSLPHLLRPTSLRLYGELPRDLSASGFKGRSRQPFGLGKQSRIYNGA